MVHFDKVNFTSLLNILEHLLSEPQLRLPYIFRFLASTGREIDFFLLVD